MKFSIIKLKAIASLLALLCLTSFGAQSLYAANAFDTVQGQGVVKVLDDGRKVLVDDDGEHRIYKPLEKRDIVGYDQHNQPIYDHDGINLIGADRLMDGDTIVFGADDWDGSYTGLPGMQFKHLWF